MNNRWSIVILGLLCALFCAVFFAFFEYYEEEQHLGWGRDAKRNPYLAAQMFHQQRGFQASSSDSLIKLGELANYETLFVDNGGQIISKKRLQQIIQWIDAGGHLIVAAQNTSDNENSRLFDYLELQVVQTNFVGSGFLNSATQFPPDETNPKPQPQVDESHKQAESEKQAASHVQAGGASPQQKVAKREAKVAEKELSTLVFEGVEGELTIHFAPSLGITHPAFTDSNWQSAHYQTLYWAGSRYGVHFFQLEHGSGLVTVVASPGIFQSSNIILFDHSYLWQILVNQDDLGIIYGVNMPSLWSMLIIYMPELLSALLVLTIAWVWHKRQRFGPLINDAVTVRRSSAEHIAASAAYIWRGDWQQRLLQPVRDDIQQRAERRVTGYDTADPAQQLLLLATATELTLSSVQHAMHNREKLSEEHFLRSVRLLQRIRDKL
ncbi:MAG: DUF4350 domain-containing protein [Cellvibrionaceae bacterium]|nr:DUF4350 domain-containing protein [Cellvibrionaceae bacterium]